jgi:uncharacterized protein
MPRHLFKRWFPAHKVREHKHFTRFAKFLGHNYLWHLNRHTTAKAFLIGIFACFIPMPFQMFLAAALALLVRCNLPVAVLLVWISNPLTYLPIFYFSYQVGVLFIGAPLSYADFSWDWQLFILIWQPLLLGSVINGLFFGALGYIAVLFFWRWHIVRKYNRRHQAR